MGTALAQLLTPQVQAAFFLIIALLVLLYVLSIIWVVRDAYQRGAVWYGWGAVALIPFVGVLIYTMLRPSMYASDRDEQELELLLKRRQLMKFGECPKCGYPTEEDYVMCPQCHTPLKRLCFNCGRALFPEWSVCPYCAAPQKQVSKAAPQNPEH